MTETGVVERVTGGEAVIAFARTSACGKCNACARGKDGMRVTMPNAIGAREGQRVTVEIPDGRVASYSLLAYIVPLLALLLGVALGAPLSGALNLAWSGDLTGACAGILLMGAAFIIVRGVDKRLGRRGMSIKLIGVADKV